MLALIPEGLPNASLFARKCTSDLRESFEDRPFEREGRGSELHHTYCSTDCGVAIVAHGRFVRANRLLNTARISRSDKARSQSLRISQGG